MLQSHMKWILFTRLVLPALAMLLLASLLPASALAADIDMNEVTQESHDEETQDSQIRRYRNPEERREAGVGTQLTDWFRIAGLIEVEKEYLKEKNIDAISVSGSGRPTHAVQLAALITPADWLEIEIIYEVEREREYKTTLDEGLIDVDLNDWGIKVGKQNLPFGEFYSHFSTGPLLEFAEVRESSLIVDYSIDDNIELAVFVYESDIDQLNSSQAVDWGFSMEIVSKDEAVRFGASYLSDLAETKDALLDSNTYQQRVAAWSAYLLLGMKNYELTAELVRASTAFQELDSEANKPGAYNLELAWFPDDRLQFAIRAEHSEELSDEPENQYGIAATWYAAKQISFSIDYIVGKYKPGFAFDDNDIELVKRNTLGAQLSFEF